MADDTSSILDKPEDKMHTHKTISPLLNVITHAIKRDLYKSINPTLFDVSLRDGIQNADPSKYDTKTKKHIFHHIFDRYSPKKIEIGSMASPKVLPIMSDTVNLHEYAMNYIDQKESLMVPYVLIPNNKNLQNALCNGMYNFSFITSVSNAFQLKNTRNTLGQAKVELKLMEHSLNCYRRTHNRKLYISCINECPLAGKIDNDFVVKEILYYHTNYDFSELCLSDTMGTLSFEDFEYIVDTILYFGVPPSKISLHLHVSSVNRPEIKQILYYCFGKQINKFDVSTLTEGGCSVTMGESAPSNLTYDMFYETLDSYIENKLLYQP